MKSFQSFMNELKLPICPFLLEIDKIGYQKTAKGHVIQDISKRLSKLDSERVKFIHTQESSRHNLKNVGVVFSGGQAPGGHNVIWGIYDALSAINPNAELIGFLGGPSGIIENKFKNLNFSEIKNFRNCGGFDLIGSGRTKIETTEQFEKSLNTINSHKLDALVIIGGDDSNTNAALLAQFLKEKNNSCIVVGVPKTIDGDLKNEYIETSFGFDTAAKLFSELTSNIARDCLSAKKYTHFIKIMGRTASHLALEVALKSHPNLTFISEELLEKKSKLFDVVSEIADLVESRSKKKKDYGVIVIPEGLIEALSDVSSLLKELSHLISKHGKESAKHHLQPELKDLFEKLPLEIQKQLCYDLDPHGNVQVSLIETEKLLIELVKQELKNREFEGKFSPLSHFFGYEGRSCFPSYFDLIYTYHLGFVSMLAARGGLSGYIVSIRNLKKAPSEWTFEAVPVICMVHLEMRKGENKPVIKKALVETKSHRFKEFNKIRESLKDDDKYIFVGPNQYTGDFELIYQPPLILDDN